MVGARGGYLNPVHEGPVVGLGFDARMSELDSQVAAVHLPPEKLPVYHAHHRAKHELLRRYMDVWMPKLGFSYGQVALVDGFASAGRYRDGQRGSPLLMFDAYVGRTAGDRARFKRGPHFIFIERRKDYAQHLKAEVESYPTTHGATVDVIHRARAGPRRNRIRPEPPSLRLSSDTIDPAGQGILFYLSTRRTSPRCAPNYAARSDEPTYRRRGPVKEGVAFRPGSCYLGARRHIQRPSGALTRPARP